MNPTQQQAAIENVELHKGIIKVDARAGAGKTSSLVLLAKKQEELGRRGLYVAFNKSSATDAASRFPDSVVCKTINAIAYAYVGKNYKHKLRNLRMTDVMNCLKLDNDWEMAKLIMENINKWCVSAQPHLPKRIFSTSVHPSRARFVIEKSDLFWRMMCDPKNTTAPMTHDGYLKLYELSRPTIPRDFIMLDEGQDTNPVTWSILSNQVAPLIVVGDQYQSIYQFRGAFNAMEKVQADQVLTLTQSFRFGPSIANIANRLLHSFYADDLDIEGLGPSTVVGPISPDKRHAVICRTNAEVFQRAVEAHKAKRSTAFVGGVESYGFENLLQAWHLKNREAYKVKDQFLKSFRTFGELESYADQTEDPEVMRMIRIIETHGSNLVDLIPAITKACIPNIEDAALVLTTAHKCKGLTLPYVILANDFPELIDEHGQLLAADKLDRQEVNLLYVAVTRASHGLELNDTTKDFMSIAVVN